MKKFLITSAVLLVLALLSVLFVFWYVVSLSAGGSDTLNTSTRSSSADYGSSNTSSVQATENKETYELSEAQVNRIEAVGIESENLEITPSMINCAEEKIGAERSMQIAEGDSPTAIELISLLGCLNS